jgi:hypothetical protein
VFTQHVQPLPAARASVGNPYSDIGRTQPIIPSPARSPACRFAAPAGPLRIPRPPDAYLAVTGRA